MLDRAFPQRIDQIIAVIDATTPEAADEAADALVKDLSSRSDVIRTVTQPDGGEFFARNGILFLTTDEVRRNTAELIAAQPFLGTLACRSDAARRPSYLVAVDRGHSVWGNQSSKISGRRLSPSPMPWNSLRKERILLSPGAG